MNTLNMDVPTQTFIDNLNSFPLDPDVSIERLKVEWQGLRNSHNWSGPRIGREALILKAKEYPDEICAITGWDFQQLKSQTKEFCHVWLSWLNLITSEPISEELEDEDQATA